MAIQWIAGDTFTCLSTDTKPTLVPTDTKAIETNTHNEYIYNGSAWVFYRSANKTETITGKTISGASNTLTSIPVNSLSNFAVASPTTNQVLQYNGTNWVNATSAAAGGAASNVYNYKIYLDGANTRLVSLHNTSVDTSNSDAKIVFDAAVAISGGPTIKVMPGTYLFSDSWNCVDKNFRVDGSRVAMNGNAGATGDTILKANFDHATKPLINEVNTAYSKQQFKDIVVDADFRVAYGIDAFDIKETMPWLENVAVFNADIDGVSLANTTYVSIVNAIIARNAGAGLHWKGPTAADKVNTTLVLGGRITTNGYNIRTTGYAVGNQVIGCIMEQGNDYIPFTNSIRMDSNQARDNVFRDCSLEYAGAVNKEIIYDNGYNNRYDCMRFGTFHSTFTPIRFGPTSRNNVLQNPQITCNNANTTAIIINDSGADGNRVVNPAVSWSLPLDVYVKNAGGKHSLILENLPLKNFHAMESYLPFASGGRWGQMFLGGGWVEFGFFQGMADVGTGSSATPATAEEGRARRWTTAGAAGDNAGTNLASGTLLYPSWNPKLSVRFRLGDATNSRVYIGFNTTGASPAGNDPLNALSGLFFGKISTGANWVFMHNNGSGATIVDDYGVAADNNIHTVYLECDSTAMYYQLDDLNMVRTTTEMPLSSAFMSPIMEIEAVGAAPEFVDIFEADMRSF